MGVRVSVRVGVRVRVSVRVGVRVRGGEVGVRVRVSVSVRVRVRVRVCANNRPAVFHPSRRWRRARATHQWHRES